MFSSCRGTAVPRATSTERLNDLGMTGLGGKLTLSESHREDQVRSSPDTVNE